MSFTNQEYAEIHYLYGFCDGNASAAQREYTARYPGRRVPSTQVFTRVHQRLVERGTVHKERSELGAAVLDVQTEEEILERVVEDPTISTRTLELETGVSKTAVWSILNKNKFYPYHLTKVQGLEPNDLAARQEFCRYLLNSDIEQYHFFKKILWTDEALFTRQGVFNFHNMHMWDSENPQAAREMSFQRRFNVNVWAAVIGDRFLGPHIFQGSLNGNMYLDFLQHDLPQLLDVIDPAQRQNIIYQQDGAPPHFTNAVREWLSTNYPIWIGRGGSVPWPPRSPDLNPMDFFVWGFMKSEVYSTPVNTEEELLNRIQDAAQRVREKLSHKVTVGAMRKGARACLRENGGHFENKLK